MRNKITLLLVATCMVWILFFSSTADTAETLRIGALFPFTGSLALQGGNQFRGLEIAKDMQNEKGGLWGKQIEFIKGDAVDPKKSMTECERLINVEKLKIICGTYSSSCAYTASAVAEREGVFYLEGNAISDELTSRGFKYFFRTNVRGADYGLCTVPFIERIIAPKLGKDPKNLKMATVFEDTLYGTTNSGAFVQEAKKQSLNVVEIISYNAAKAQDFSPIILKLRSVNPDVLYVVPYVKDFILFWRQAKDLNLNIPIVIGGGTVGEEGVLENLGKDVDYIFNAYSPQFCNPNALSPQARSALGDFEKRYLQKFKESAPPLAIAGFSTGWVLFQHILPKAGGLDAEALRKAALALEIPEGGTPLGFGVKFAPPGHPHAGHNLSAFGIIQQYQEGKRYVVYPNKYALRSPLLPLPTWEERAKGITRFIK